MGYLDNLATMFCKQDAVYWGNPTQTGTGAFTFDDPVEIQVRWDDKQELVIDDKGNEVVSRASVMVKQDVDLGGMLMLGTIDDIDSGLYGDPYSLDNAFRIIAFTKIPAPMKTDDFYRSVHLGNK